jgi:hypothetical protein
MNSEIGRELKANELKVKTVVVLMAERSRWVYTAWVYELGQDFVIFSYEIGPGTKVKFVAHLREDGTLADDAARKITVHEYLGEI